MFGPTRYLRWASRFYGQIPFDLATSGMTPVPIAELGTPRLDDPSAWERLRGAIARMHGVPRDEVLPTMGTTHGLFCAYAATLAPGDEALVEEPAYEPLVRTAEGLGARVTRFARPVEERFALDPARVAAAMTERTRVVAITNLHNPGGVRASDETIREVARVAASRGATLLVDEVYAPFDALVADDGTWSGSARRLGENVVVAASLTKGYGLGAHRIGWMIGPRELAARGEDAIVASLGHAPIPWACLGAHAFTRLPELAARARDRLRGKRERVAAWVRVRPDLAWSAPDAGLFGFATKKGSGEDLTVAIEAGARDVGVLVAAGSFFGVPNGFRLAWAIDGDRLDEALARLDRALPR